MINRGKMNRITMLLVLVLAAFRAEAAAEGNCQYVPIDLTMTQQQSLCPIDCDFDISGMLVCTVDEDVIMTEFYEGVDKPEGYDDDPFGMLSCAADPNDMAHGQLCESDAFEFTEEGHWSGDRPVGTSGTLDNCNGMFDVYQVQCEGEEVATCDDNKQNGDETGVDCGGSLCFECLEDCWVCCSHDDCDIAEYCYLAYDNLELVNECAAFDECHEDETYVTPCPSMPEQENCQYVALEPAEIAEIPVCVGSTSGYTLDEYEYLYTDYNGYDAPDRLINQDTSPFGMPNCPMDPNDMYNGQICEADALWDSEKGFTDDVRPVGTSKLLDNCYGIWDVYKVVCDIIGAEDEEEDTCSTCCSHTDCPSDKYCAMGYFGSGGFYNQCDPLADCGSYGDEIETCPESEETVSGCTDTEADNYNAAATQDDGSCTYPEDEVVETCSTCCSHSECPSDTYCAMGHFPDSGNFYNSCDAGDECGDWGDEIEACPEPEEVCMAYSFTCGSYCEEVSWLLKIGGSIICSGSKGVAGVCCPEAITSYTLEMSDSWGDGWTGGKIVIGDEEYTLSGGSSESVEIAATAVPDVPSNEATVITMATSLTIGDGDNADEAASVAAAAFANSVGAALADVDFTFFGRRQRRLLGQSLDLEISLTTTDSSLAESALEAASADDFSATMAAEMENVAAEMGVTVTVESLETEAPTESTIVTGCPSLAKTECKADSSCFYHKNDDSCYDPSCSVMHSSNTCEGDNGLEGCQWVKADKLCREIPVGCPIFIKGSDCKADDTCSWIDGSCEDKAPGCGGYSKKGECKSDDTCMWNSSSKACFDKPSGCGAHGSKKQCWSDSELVCAWNFDLEKCQGGECAGMEKKECKGNENKCTWAPDTDGVKTCSAV